MSQVRQGAGHGRNQRRRERAALHRHGSRFITSGNDHSFIVSGSIERAIFYHDLAEEAGNGNKKKNGKMKRG